MILKNLQNADNLFVKMRLFQKISLSLLATLIIFSAFLLTSNSLVFKSLEAKFYRQTKIQQNTEKLNEISQSYNDYFSDFLNSVGGNENSWLNLQSVRSFYDQNPSEVNVAARRTATESLFSKFPGLKGIRIIDKNGRNVHFSTFDKTDVFQQKGITKIYKNYDEICEKSNEIAFADLEKNSDILKPKFLFDEMRSQVIISAPFNFMENIFSGFAFFYFDFVDLQFDLAEKNNFEYNVKLSLFSDSDFSGVFVQGVPESEKNQFKNVCLEFYKKNQKITENKIPEKLLQANSSKNNKTDDFWVALSDTNDNPVKILGVYKNSVFEIPRGLYFTVLLCIFISLFLILFLVFSLKRDSAVILKEKIKKIQLNIIQECFESGEKINLETLFKKLEIRKNDFSEEIVKSLKIRSKKKQNEINLLLKKNWEEIFSIFQTQIPNQNQTEEKNFVPAASAASVDYNSNLIEEIRKLLQEMLQNVEVKKENVPRAALEEMFEPEETDAADKIEEIGEVEELDEAENADETVETDEVEELNEVAETTEQQETAGEAETEWENEKINGVEKSDEINEFSQLNNAEKKSEAGQNLYAELESPDEVEEITPLEPILEPLTFEKLLDTDAFLKNQPHYTYALTNETYFASDIFATVDNVFAEEICLGSGVSTKNIIVPINFKVYQIEKYWNDNSCGEEDFAKNLNEKENFTDEEELIAQKNQKEQGGQTFAQEMPQKLEEQKNLQNNLQETNGQKITEKNQTADAAAKIKNGQNPQNDEIENLTEEVPPLNEFSYYSMTKFAENVTGEMPMLDAADVPQDTVVQKDGIYTISQQTDYKNSAQDKDLKSFVDSVI